MTGLRVYPVSYSYYYSIIYIVFPTLLIITIAAAQELAFAD